MQNIEDLIIDKAEYSKQEIVSLLKTENDELLLNLFQFADQLRSENVGDKVFLSNLIQFSNYCTKNCLYCGLRKSNFKIQRYRLNLNQIIELAIDSEKQGFKSVTLESGDDEFFDLDLLLKIIKTIKDKTKLSVILSIGERTEAEYLKFKEAGCDKYILKHRTSDPILYRQLHPDLKYSNRIKSLKSLKNIGFKVQSGVFVGLPGQTFESIANDILLFKELNIDIIQIQAYIPHPDTPLARKFDQIGGYFAPAVGYFEVEDLLYKIIAITRLVNKQSNILVSQVSNNNVDNLSFFEKSLKYGADSVLLGIFESELPKSINSYTQSNSNKETESLLKNLTTKIKTLHREII